MSNSVAPTSEILGLKQFRHGGCVSHFVFDGSTREGMLIDPRVDLMEEYRAFIAESRIQPRWVVDTALHWHHLSGSHLFAETYGVPIAMSAHTRSERVTHPLSDGQKIKVGRWEFTVLATPGVSPDAICLWGAGVLLSGDTLIIGTPARTDLPGGDAGALWDSLQRVVAPLPGTTLVLSGHDAQDLLFSTLSVETKRAPDWQLRTRAEFVRAKADEKSSRGDGDVKQRLDYNLHAQPAASSESHFGGLHTFVGATREARGVASISVEKCAQKLKSPTVGTCFLDVREPSEFAQSHLAGALNVPLSELAVRLPELRLFKRIYIYCTSGSRSSLAARTLDFVGLPDVVHVSGGLRAWENAGLALVKRL